MLGNHPLPRNLHSFIRVALRRSPAITNASNPCTCHQAPPERRGYLRQRLKIFSRAGRGGTSKKSSPDSGQCARVATPRSVAHTLRQHRRPRRAHETAPGAHETSEGHRATVTADQNRVLMARGAPHVAHTLRQLRYRTLPEPLESKGHRTSPLVSTIAWNPNPETPVTPSTSPCLARTLSHESLHSERLRLTPSDPSNVHVPGNI